MQDEFHEAVAASLENSHEFSVIRNKLLPMWRSLAKNEHGRIDRRSLRYMVHRYLLRTHYIVVNGLQPLQKHANKTEAALFFERAPLLVKQALEKASAQRGFSLGDAAAMVAMLLELVAHDARELVDFLMTSKRWKQEMSLALVDRRLESFLVRWMVGNDPDSLTALERNPSLITESFNEWQKIASFLHGKVLAWQRDRWVRPLSTKQRFDASPGSWHPLGGDHFSRADLQTVVSDIVLSFGSFWHTECDNVRATLVKLDRGGTGRVLLSDFHGAALEGEWRFGESVEYLRSLGAIDETSQSIGPRVIVPNYLQGPNNCMVTADHYRVCCANDCDSYLSEIEEEVRAPSASPEFLIGIIQSITINLADDTPLLTERLKSQLRLIAATHGGLVPLHGRLFAQWLHFVFPRDCPFPHKAGSVSDSSPLDFGNRHLATSGEMEKHAALPTTEDENSSDDRLSQWSHEEELLTDCVHLQAPWEARYHCGWLMFFVWLAGAAVFVRKAFQAKTLGRFCAFFSGSSQYAGAHFRCDSKAHYV
eukprot:TRINITY_DN2792_c0_g2_i6.p1 TRINITY_DN2792_c0_g2~~TRINITY_DN2792_c0_g2_i6.p1  ORF type:complete len:628 (-),score=78.64 TRINITY_DN2792_c0_g2_i6:457-2064(-)